MGRLKRKKDEAAPVDSIHEKVAPQDAGITAEEMRSILDEKTNKGRDPVKVMFMCAKGDDISHTMQKGFEAELTDKGLQPYFTISTGGMWVEKSHTISEAIRGYDIISTSIVHPYDSGVPQPIEEALALLDESSRPAFIPLIVEHDINGPKMLEQIRKTDYGPLLQQMVRFLRQQ